MTARLERVTMASAAWIAPRNGSTTRMEPLVISRPEAMAMPAELVEGPPDSGALLERFEPRGEPFILAARVRGPVRTAFPDGPPEGVEEAQPHLDEPRASLNLILIGDSDVLADQSWVRRQNVGGGDGAGGRAQVPRDLAATVEPSADPNQGRALRLEDRTSATVRSRSSGCRWVSAQRLHSASSQPWSSSSVLNRSAA